VRNLELLPSNGLIDRALVLLGAGPCTTERLAAEVLALRGNRSVAAAAVFALLGTDPRFAVDGCGIWRLAERTLPADVPLLAEEWVVVDVETTGGSPAAGHRVIEIAAVRVSQGVITERYSTLVNPLRRIPPMITSLTGIGDRMVVGAPSFDEIAAPLGEFLRGRIFVAHNAGFDWRFVCTEMERSTGRTLEGRKLCTLRLARRLLSHLPSRSLGALARHYGLDMETQHRALDDAVATAQLLLLFLPRLEEHGVASWANLDGFFGSRTVRRKRTAMPRGMDAEK
jgi:DNA polymerase III subunit epsilon